MSWKSTMRTIDRMARQAERDARRRQRELERQQKELAKMLEQERARHEVAIYENQIEILLSIHKECLSPIKWEQIRDSSPPSIPTETHIHEIEAQKRLDEFSPSFIDKLLKRDEKKREELRQALREANEKDSKEFQNAMIAYEQEYSEWEDLQRLSIRILNGDSEAYIEAVNEINPFVEISELGSEINFNITNPLLGIASVAIHGEDVIPNEVKTILKSGKLSVKDMTKTEYYGLYQDYVIGSALRIAREIFALIPVKAVIVHAMGEVLNTQTGHLEMQPILSVAIPRDSMERLNFEYLDPSDAMNNFVHRMTFRKTKGFLPVEAIRPEELDIV